MMFRHVSWARQQHLGKQVLRHLSYNGVVINDCSTESSSGARQSTISILRCVCTSNAYKIYKTAYDHFVESYTR